MPRFRDGWAHEPDPANKSLRKCFGDTARDFCWSCHYLSSVMAKLVGCKPGAADTIPMLQGKSLSEN